MLLDFLMVPWAMVMWGLWLQVGHWLFVIVWWVTDSSFCDGCAEFVAELELSPVTRIQPYASQGKKVGCR